MGVLRAHAQAGRAAACTHAQAYRPCGLAQAGLNPVVVVAGVCHHAACTHRMKRTGGNTPAVCCVCVPRSPARPGRLMPRLALIAPIASAGRQRGRHQAVPAARLRGAAGRDGPVHRRLVARPGQRGCSTTIPGRPGRALQGWLGACVWSSALSAAWRRW